jgi:signal transduction histidine kinase
VRANKEYVESIPGIMSELAVPVETESRTLGVLNVESKKTAAFDIRDMHLLQILASHAATALSNLEKRKEIEKRSNQLASLMRSSTRIMSSTSLRQRLQTIAEAIRELGWRRVVISVRDENMEIANPEDIVTAGLTKNEANFLWDNRPPGQVWRERFGPDFARFRVGEFYHLPWSDPWVRKRFSDSTVPSKLSPEDMVDWDPQDLLYAPLRLADGHIVGVLSVDDPTDGRRPTKESLAPLELFIHQAAVAIENAQLIQSLHVAREQLKADAEMLESKVEERTQELKKSQEQLLKAQRLAAIGELASMIGHDLRNPLTGIAGATYYLRSKLSKKANKKTKEMLRLIERDIEYSNKIINDLLDYSREMQLELVETTPKKLMKEALTMANIPKNVKVKDLTRSKTRINVDSEKMKRVFVNIIRNAVEAMPKGGILIFRSRETDDNLEVDFSDTGTGIPQCILTRMWTPLFTTKAKGMGLGLSICKRIMEAHGGRIAVQSIVGKGTTFTVAIPLKCKPVGGEKIWMQPQESSLLTTTKA